MKNVTNIYRAPETEVLEYAAHSILCESLPGTGSTGFEEIGGEDELVW